MEDADQKMTAFAADYGRKVAEVIASMLDTSTGSLFVAIQELVRSVPGTPGTPGGNQLVAVPEQGAAVPAFNLSKTVRTLGDTLNQMTRHMISDDGQADQFKYSRVFFRCFPSEGAAKVRRVSPR